MLGKLKDLIFGFNEFEKTKVEIRFELLQKSLFNIKIEQLEHFEVVEECIYKIKEQLRVKSSNLNKAINDPSRNVKRREIIEFLDRLNTVKYEFLNSAFSVIKEKESVVNEEIALKQIPVNNDERVNEDLKSKENVEIIETGDYKLILENGRTPYVLVIFKKNYDFLLLKNIASLIFDIYKAQGTNIIVEESRALIIPRFQEDSLFELPRIQIDIEEIYARIRKITEIENKFSSDEYLNIDEDYKPIQKARAKEDKGLDILLEEVQQKKPEFKSTPHPQDDKEKPQVIIDEPVIVEKDEKEIKEPEISIEKVNDVNSYDVYKDEKIIAYLEKNSKTQGELVIQSVDSKPFKELNESEISYISIFSKIFSAAIFEVKKAHGTNILWDYNSNKVRIIPRYNNDELGLMWEAKENTEDFLEQVKNQLLEGMSKGVAEQKGEKLTENVKSEKLKEKDTTLEQKAKYILDSLRRIP